MKKAQLIMLLVAIFAVILTYWFYGAYAFIATPIFLLAFVLTLGFTAYFDSLQAKSIPGITTLKEPDFFFSGIFMAWLYVNDKQRWARYAALVSYLLGILWSSLFAIPIALSLKLELSVLLATLVFGMFITLLLAITVATSRRWTEETK
jgi:hypothetical protein